MGGAFVAVANDSTATWWNPAGLAGGAFFDLALERGAVTEPVDPPSAGPAAQTRNTSVSIAFPALGLSYYRFRVSEIRPLRPTGVGLPDRQEEGAAGIGLHSLAASHYGVTVGQSLGNHLVIASTLKLVRAGSGVSTAPSVADADDGFERADDLERSGDTEGDLDVGVMATAGVWCAGLTVKHLREPRFDGGDGEFELSRIARAGVAVIAGPRGPLNGIIAAVDADLTRTETVAGEARRLAGGVEAWMLNRRIGLRGGVNVSTIGDRRAVTSAGASIGVRAGAYLEGAWMFGSSEAIGGWRVAARMTF
jgi:hypothetical protein